MPSVQGSLEICEVHEMVHEEKVPKEHAQAITEHLRNSRLHADEFANASAWQPELVVCRLVLVKALLTGPHLVRNDRLDAGMPSGTSAVYTRWECGLSI